MTDFDRDRALRSVVAVGTGRGFVIDGPRDRFIITAAHCIDTKFVCHPIPNHAERTYESLIGLLVNDNPEKTYKAWAECLFADPISDIAVLAAPDKEYLPAESGKYTDLLNTCMPFKISDPPSNCTGWLLSLSNNWFSCDMEQHGRPLFICNPVEAIAPGMSGSPILTDEGSVIGVVCIGADAGKESGPNPRLTHNLPGWLLQEIRIAAGQ